MPDMMGCIGSQLSRVITHISDSRHSRSRRNPNIFPVLNVDDLGRHLAPGKLEVTETDLILRISGKAPLTWPLRCLRRYGYENDLFSFESGRRCPTGAGIYAFKCHRAQIIFNVLQAKIQVGNLTTTLPPPLPNANGADAVNDMTPVSISPTFDYVNISDPHHQRTLTDTEPDSPQTPLDPHPTHPHPLYMNVESQKNHPLLQESGGYQNLPRKCNGHRKLTEGPSPSAPLLYTNDFNFNAKPEQATGSINYTNVVCDTRKSSIPGGAPPPEVNYAELDLEHTGKSVLGESRFSTPQHKVAKELKPGLKSSKSVGYTNDNSEDSAVPSDQSQPSELGYATIDFGRTAALSGVTRTKIKLNFQSNSTDRDDGDEHPVGSSALKKIRHNSTAM